MEEKKPAVTAKTARRGRPAGSKNKKAALDRKPKASKSFTEEVASWEAEPREEKVDYKELCQKLQDALAKSYVEVEDLQKEIKELNKKINKANIWLNLKQMRINECEELLTHAVECGDLDIGYKIELLTDDDEDASV